MSRNLSTSGSDSSSESAWQRFVRVMLLAGLLPPLVLYGLILVVDPYDSVVFSPNWERFPVRGDHRHWNAKLVKSNGYDSLVVGTSTAMLMKPEELNAALGGRFVNLAMPLASPYEQTRLLSLFEHYHRDINTVIVSVDTLWCHPKGMPEHANSRLVTAFPERLYDTNRWNDLPPLNKTSIKAAYDQARALLDIFRPYPQWQDGYEDLTVTLHEKNGPEDIRKRIHEGSPELLLKGKNAPKGIDGDIQYPDITRLEKALRALPSATRKILIFPPYHVHYQPEPDSDQGQLWEGCKQNVAGLAKHLDNTFVMDFMIRSGLTGEDAHYIDGYHTTTESASRMARLIASVIQDPDGWQGEEVRVLSQIIH